MKYKVTLGYYTSRVVEVEAETEDEAIRKGHEAAGQDPTYGEQTELINNRIYDGIYGIEEVEQ